jgi:hypothetical protein
LAAKTVEWDLMFEFENALGRSRMEENEVPASPRSCVDGLLHFGRENGLEESAKAVVDEISAAIDSDANARKAAQEVLALMINIYSRETIAVKGSMEIGNDKGRLYSVANARLRSITRDCVGGIRQSSPELYETLAATLPTSFS